jgi:hypothetical protein
VHIRQYDIDHALVEDVSRDFSELPVSSEVWSEAKGDLGFPEARAYLFFFAL